MKTLNHRYRPSCNRCRRHCLWAVLLVLYAGVFPQGLRAQGREPQNEINIGSVTVTGRQILRDVGEQRTRLDSTALRRDVTRSLADVLASGSSIYIKSYGRATLSTASFRGTAPSHTRVTWNGMDIASPMLGMVDFSLIPSYLVDAATLYHGSSSVGVAGGGLGGAVTLATSPALQKRLDVRFIQSVGSYRTFDDFLHIGWTHRRWQSSTRVVYSTSKNDFPYTNYDKKLPVLDDDGRQTGEFYHPSERNRNGSFRDTHIVQELYYNSDKGDRFSLAAWYLNSSRGIPMLGADYKQESDFRNRQKENTLRAVAGWERLLDAWRLYARAGYIYSDMRYSLQANRGDGGIASMIDSRSRVNTLFGRAGVEYFAGQKWLFTADATLDQHFVRSIDNAVIVDPAKVAAEGEKIPIGYKRARADLSLVVSAKYRPTERLGLSATLRQELNGTRPAPVIPALFAEYSLLRDRNLVLKASASRNFRFPTLNDLYYMPGGNPDLRPEKGVSWDAGAEYKFSKRAVNLSVGATYYASRITDWILWIPSFRGYWTPVNKTRVNTSGMELKGRLRWDLGGEWNLGLDGTYTISRAINRSPQISPDDNSVGRQLVYIPLRSGNVTGSLGWKRWTLTYLYGYYSERFTSSDNNRGSIVGRIAPYHMSDVALERSISTNKVDFHLKFTVDNIFGEEYESVLSRPMPGRNWGFSIGITPKFGRDRAVIR